MFAATANLHDVFRIPAVFTAILVVAGDHATATRMRALSFVLLVCHLSILLSRSKINLGGYSITEFYASQRASGKAIQADAQEQEQEKEKRCSFFLPPASCRLLPCFHG
jgi:hypothetical protein